MVSTCALMKVNENDATDAALVALSQMKEKKDAAPAAAAFALTKVKEKDDTYWYCRSCCYVVESKEPWNNSTKRKLLLSLKNDIMIPKVFSCHFVEDFLDFFSFFCFFSFFFFFFALLLTISFVTMLGVVLAAAASSRAPSLRIRLVV